MKLFWCVILVAGATGCMRAPEAVDAQIDPGIAAELARVKAIDNHAHPVRQTATGEAPDTGYDALPVESLEPSSDIVRFRPGQPAFGAASKAIFGGGRAAAAKAWGGNYAATILDKAGIDK